MANLNRIRAAPASAALSQRLTFPDLCFKLSLVHQTHFRVPLTAAIALVGLPSPLKATARIVNPAFLLPSDAAMNQLDLCAPTESFRRCLQDSVWR